MNPAMQKEALVDYTLTFHVTPGIAFELPRMGDVILGVSTKGSIRANVLGQHCNSNTFNLLRIQNHTASVTVDDQEIQVQYRSYTDTAFRAAVASKETNEPKPLEWYLDLPS